MIDCPEIKYKSKYDQMDATDASLHKFWERIYGHTFSSPLLCKRKAWKDPFDCVDYFDPRDWSYQLIKRGDTILERIIWQMVMLGNMLKCLYEIRFEEYIPKNKKYKRTSSKLIFPKGSYEWEEWTRRDVGVTELKDGSRIQWDNFALMRTIGFINKGWHTKKELEGICYHCLDKNNLERRNYAVKKMKQFLYKINKLGVSDTEFEELFSFYFHCIGAELVVPIAEKIYEKKDIKTNNNRQFRKDIVSKYPDIDHTKIPPILRQIEGASNSIYYNSNYTNYFSLLPLLIETPSVSENILIQVSSRVTEQGSWHKVLRQVAGYWNYQLVNHNTNAFINNSIFLKKAAYLFFMKIFKSNIDWVEYYAEDIESLEKMIDNEYDLKDFAKIFKSLADTGPKIIGHHWPQVKWISSHRNLFPRDNFRRVFLMTNEDHIKLHSAVGSEYSDQGKFLEVMLDLEMIEESVVIKIGKQVVSCLREEEDIYCSNHDMSKQLEKDIRKYINLDKKGLNSYGKIFSYS